MNGWKMQKFIELWTNQKQTCDSALVQSKVTKTIYMYINSIRIILDLDWLHCYYFVKTIHFSSESFMTADTLLCLSGWKHLKFLQLSGIHSEYYYTVIWYS
jgi:hypothetical protein